MLCLDFSNKTVIVTGGASGIGLATAKAFLNCGANVVICDRRKAVLEKAVRDIKKDIKSRERILAVTCDMSREKDVSVLVNKTLKKFSGLDIFVNNAGTWLHTPVESLKEKDISTILGDNLVTTILGTKHAARNMTKGGVIINTCSFAARMSRLGSGLYAAAKSGVEQFTRISAAELAHKNIRVNCIIPGVIQTPMAKASQDKNKKELLRSIPMKRFATPEQVANAVLFLASDLAQYITGASLEVTGGKYTAQL